jgi:hypothetical protein
VNRRRLCAAGATTLAAGLLCASAAAAAPRVAVSALSSLRAGASVGTLTGRVVNEDRGAREVAVTVRLLRRGVHPHVVGRTSVRVGTRGSAAYAVKVKLPAGLPRGSYYLAACTPSGASLSCATARDDVLIKGGSRVRPALARASAAGACSSGAHTLSAPGSRVYPETGNGGYQSLHSDVFMVYDAASNAFLPGNHVDLTQRATQCLTDFSLDFERTNSSAGGPNMTVTSVAIDGQPAAFKFVQPTYPGDPNGQDDPDPLAHQASLTNPVSATNPNPPACTPAGTNPSLQGQPCPATKLVITPAAPIPSGTTFKVTVAYTGNPGVHTDGDGSDEGWFRNNNPIGDGGFVTTEPVGTMAWMPLNNHPTVKPTYDFYDTVTAGRTAIANGRSTGFTDNAPDANFPGGSRTWSWHSSAPIAGYLVENTVGNYDEDTEIEDAGVLYYHYQASAISPSQKAANKLIMDDQEDITSFQSGFNGPFPFDADGVIIGLPTTVGFEEEMQTKITFKGGNIGRDAQTLSHENMHQWWGDNVSEGSYSLTFYKEGYATLSEYLFKARAAAGNVGVGSPEWNAAFEASLASQFSTNYGIASSGAWAVAPSNPQASNLFTTANTYRRPGTSYVALRAILGKDRFNSANREIQSTYGGGSITEPQLIAVYQKWLPNQSTECHAKLALFFAQWWDTAYPSAGQSKPQITGPGLAGPGFYDGNGGCSDTGVSTVSGTVPSTLSLTLDGAVSLGVFTPGVAKSYGGQMTASVISTAGDAALSVADPSPTAPGHLVNGAFALPSALRASAASPAGASAPGGALGSGPLSLLTWAGPVSNDAVAISFTQPIAATDALRTGSYSKTLTFTLSTTTP